MGIREKIVKAMQTTSCSVVLERFKFTKAFMKTLNPSSKKISKPKVEKVQRIFQIPKIPKIRKLAKVKKIKEKKALPASREYSQISSILDETPLANKHLEITGPPKEDEDFFNQVLNNTSGSFVKGPPQAPPRLIKACSKCGKLFNESCTSVCPRAVNSFFAKRKVREMICGMCFLNMIAED